MKVVTTKTVEFEDWEKAYLVFEGYDWSDITLFEKRAKMIDPNIFQQRFAKVFKAGYEAGARNNQEW